MKFGVWGFVTGTEIEPDEDENNAVWRKWNERKDKALANIVLAVEPSLLYLLGDPQDPAEVWKKLADQFEKKSWANKLALRRKLYSLKLKENESVQNHIKSMIEIFESLSVVGYVVEEEDRVVHLLASLPDSYQMLVTALEANSEVPKLEVVTERLLHEEKKLSEKSEQYKPPENALLVRSRASGGPVCFYCGESGHIKKFCEEWKKKIEEEEKKGKMKQNEESSFFCQRAKSRFDSDSESEVECIALASQASTVEHSNHWVIDSAASHHMCNDSSAMRNLKELDTSQQIKVGNGDIVEAKIEGTVKLEINAGSSTRKFKLQKVLFAPDLKYNLFSVPKATEAGKTIEFGKQGCRIIEKSTRQTIGSGRKRGNLYYINCVRKNERKINRNNGHNLNNKQMAKALKVVLESNFEKEMMSRLERVEKRMTHSYTIKEEIDQNPEMKISKREDCSEDQIQEDKKPSISECLNWKDDEIQEDKIEVNNLEEESKVSQCLLSWKNEFLEDKKELNQVIENGYSPDELKDQTNGCTSVTKKEKVKRGFFSKLKRKFVKFQ